MWLDMARRGRVAGATRDIGGIERHRPLGYRSLLITFRRFTGGHQAEGERNFFELIAAARRGLNHYGLRC